MQAPTRSAGAWFFVTPEAKGYAEVMRSRCSLVDRLCVGAVLCGAALAAPAATVLYKWVDAGGVTHYADRPEPGAHRVQIGSAQSYPGATARSSPAPRPTSAAVEPTHYTRLAIVSPPEGTSVWNDGGQVAVAAALEPELAAGHQIWFVIDGKTQASPGGGLSTTLEVPRGSHTVAVMVTDASGIELISSATVSFAVHQTSSPSVARGPLLPKPKPRAN